MTSTNDTLNTTAFDRIADRLEAAAEQATGRLTAALAVKGILALLFGAVLLAWPQPTVLAMVLVFGSFAVVEGAVAIYHGATTTRRDDKWPMILQGTAGVVVGLMVFAWPGITALTLLFMIGIWATVQGVSQLTVAHHLRRDGQSWGLVATGGALAVLFGIGVIVNPGAGAVSLVWLIATLAFVTGTVCITAAIGVHQARAVAQAAR